MHSHTCTLMGAPARSLTCTDAHTHVLTHMHTDAHMDTCTHTCAHNDTRALTCVHAHTHTHTHTHTHPSGLCPKFGLSGRQPTYHLSTPQWGDSPSPHWSLVAPPNCHPFTLSVLSTATSPEPSPAPGTPRAIQKYSPNKHTNRSRPTMTRGGNVVWCGVVQEQKGSLVEPLQAPDRGAAPPQSWWMGLITASR